VRIGGDLVFTKYITIFLNTLFKNTLVLWRVLNLSKSIIVWRGFMGYSGIIRSKLNLVNDISEIFLGCKIILSDLLK
jgi:hypothetical protein